MQRGSPPESTRAVATNGVIHAPPRMSRATVAGERDPMAKVLDLGTKATSTIALALLFALLVHGTAAARTALISLDLLRWSRMVQDRISERLTEEYDLDVAKSPEPPPPPPPEPEVEKAPARPPPAAKAQQPEAPPPEAAQAGKILTAEPDPNAPVDLTGGFISGSGTSYAGGVTQAGGTGKNAVYAPAARATGVPGGTGQPNAPAPAGPDRSRAAGLSGASEWKCPWPAEAEAEQIDEAFVKVQVSVGANGKATSVSVLSDPGHGFAREAQRCAMRESFAPALDRDGTAIPGTTKVLKVHFER